MNWHLAAEKSPETEYLEQEGENATKKNSFDLSETSSKNPLNMPTPLLMSLGLKAIDLPSRCVFPRWEQTMSELRL